MLMMSKYSHLSNEDLIRILERRDAERKLGLNWERNSIEHELALNEDFIALDFNQAISYGDAPYDNLLIEGDNFDALRNLRMAYSARIKCIYIDPPYNTGNKDFIYNDNYIDKDDNFKHSKWLEFMYRRLSLAKDLLTHDGVIFVSIDDNEMGYLSVLMDEIFPNMRVGTFVWKRRSGANDPTGYFTSADHEYVLCYANPGFSFQGIDKDFSSYNNYDEGSSDPWKRGDLTKAHTYKARQNSFYPIKNPENEIWYPCNPHRVWGPISKVFIKSGKKAPKTTIEDLLSKNKILFPDESKVAFYQSLSELREAINNGDAPQYIRDNLFESEEKNLEYLNFWVGKKIGYGSPGYKRNLSELKRLEKPLSTWITSTSEKIKDDDVVTFMSSGMTQEGTKLIQQMLGSSAFSYPKPLSLIKNLIQQSTGEGDIVLDFFAGSGTTGHAVLELNAETEVERKFILVSSTEATEKEPEKNVCLNVTRERLVSAINGYSYKTKTKQESVAGVGGNFAYLVTRRIAVGHIHTDIQHDQVWHAIQQFYGYGLLPFEQSNPIQWTDTDKARLIYVPEINQQALDAVMELIENQSALVVYSWQPGLLKQRVFSDHVSFEKIPDFLVKKFGTSQ